MQVIPWLLHHGTTTSSSTFFCSLPATMFRTFGFALAVVGGFATDAAAAAARPAARSHDQRQKRQER